MTTRALHSAADADLLWCGPAEVDAAFRVLYRRWHRPLYTFLLRRVGDGAACEDLLQETFVRLWRARAGFDPGRGTVASLLFTIARNVATDELRRRGRAEAALALADRCLVTEGPEQGVVDRVDVGAAVARLSVRHRRVVEATFWRDSPQAVVAAEMGVPVGTVKSRLFHAVRAVAQEPALAVGT